MTTEDEFDRLERVLVQYVRDRVNDARRRLHLPVRDYEGLAPGSHHA